MGEETDIPVVIVGGGPIGLTLANILGKNNVETVLLEKNDTTSKWPKAMLTNPRSMELFRRLGLDTLFRQKAISGGLSVSLTTSILKSPPLLNMPLAQMMGKNPREQEDGSIIFDEEWTTEKPCRLSQIYIEPILKEEASKFESCEIKFGWQVQSISQTAEHVRVEAVNAKSGETKVYRAQYLVGSDGGKSFVRKSLGIHFKGKFELSDFKSVVFTSPEYKKRLFTDCMLTMVATPSFRGIVIRLDDDGLFVGHGLQDRGTEMEASDVMGALMDYEDIPYTQTFENSWQGHFGIAETLQDGRVFLAGDSCHIVVPVGGFGMNTGILDAYDLGWKLVGTIKGWGGERLLASYTIERHDGIKKLVARIQRIFIVLQRYAPFLVFFAITRPFKYITRLFVDPTNINIGVSGVLFGVRLETSPICIPSNLPLPPDNPYHYIPTCYPGCRAPHFKFDDGTTLYDKLGSMFTLVHLQPSDKSFEPIMAAAAHCGIPLKVVSFNDKKLKKLYRGMDFVIIRPDLYVAWCGYEIPTLLHNEDINEGARVLMKVITGAETLPVEWRQVQRKRGRLHSVWKFGVSALVLAGIGFGSLAILRHYKYVE